MKSVVLVDARHVGLGEARHMWQKGGIRRKRTLWHSMDLVLGGARSCSTKRWRDLGPAQVRLQWGWDFERLQERGHNDNMA